LGEHPKGSGAKNSGVLAGERYQYLPSTTKDSDQTKKDEAVMPTIESLSVVTQFFIQDCLRLTEDNDKTII
jgi:hypothetical protein